MHSSQQEAVGHWSTGSKASPDMVTIPDDGLRMQGEQLYLLSLHGVPFTVLGPRDGYQNVNTTKATTTELSMASGTG